MMNLSLTTLKTGYVDGTINVRELILSLREQALAQNEYNAWIHILSKEELEFYFKNLENQSPADLPLYGVPFAVKDNIDVANIPTTAACPDFAYTPSESAFVVTQLIAAGAIPLGKTNLDQFATGLVGTRSPYGEAKNVFNPDFMSGGSSSGSAIATALGQVSFALGTDTAGSGRVPAAMNNLIGHKPSKGLLSIRGVVPACHSLDCVSIFALNTNDITTIFDIAAQYDEQDPYARVNHFANRGAYYADQNLSEFTFAVPAQPDFQGNTECKALFQQSVDALIALGGTQKTLNFDPFSKAAKLLYEGPWVAERWLATQNVKRESMLPVIQAIVSGAEGRTAADAFAAQYTLQALKKECDALIKNVDFVLTPTTPSYYSRAEIAADPVGKNSILGTYTNFMNLLDFAATAVPIGKTKDKVHWGVTLFTHTLKDIHLLNFAGALHKKTGLKQGATENPLPPSSPMKRPMIGDSINVVVCGAHLLGQPLNWQLSERGGKLVEKTTSSAHYQLYALPDGRPAMVRNENGGRCIEVEVWKLPTETFGSFVEGIPAPLGIGKVELSNGEWVCGFICESSGTSGAKNITEHGSWLKWLERNAP